MISYTGTQNNLTMTKDGKTLSMSTTHKNCKEVRALLLDHFPEAAFDLMERSLDKRDVVEKRSNKDITFEGGVPRIKGEKVPMDIYKRIMEYIEQKLPFDALINFWNRLKKNPSEASKQDCFAFMLANKIPLTESGYIVAWKKVQDNYMDSHSGTILNKVGTYVEMERSKVDDNNNQACSAGLHVGGWNYVPHFTGSRILTVKVDPADVVAVPRDCSAGKMRVCRYYIVEELMDWQKYNNKDIEILHDPIFDDEKPASKKVAKKERAIKVSSGSYKQKVTAEYRLPISSDITRQIGIKPCSHIGVNVVGNTLEVVANFKSAEWNYRTDSDGRAKISKSILEKIGSTTNYSQSYIIRISEKKIIISKK